MNDLDFAYSVAYIRTIENRLLTKTDIENLVSAKSFDDAMRILVDKGFAAEQVSSQEFEKILSHQTETAWNEVTNALPEGANLELLMYKNDFHNLKVALKGVNSGVKDYEQYILKPTVLDFKLVLSAVINGDFSLLPKEFAEPLSEAFDVLSRTSDSQLADIIIDKAEMDYTYKKAVETGSDFLIGYVKLLNTLSDIKTAVRCKKTEKTLDFAERAISDSSDISKQRLIRSVLSGEDAVIQEISEQGFSESAEALKISLAEFEKYSDMKITEYMKNAAYMAFGIEPIVAYINKKRSEVQSVRIILSGKAGGLSPDEIRLRLRSYF